MLFWIYSTFRSFDGEVNCFYQGAPTLFIRFAGCNMNPPCSYCDTLYAHRKRQGKRMLVNSLLRYVDNSYPFFNKATITGGEPLFQKDGLLELIVKLKREGKRVSVETNGSLPIPMQKDVAPDCWVVDYKLPSSGAHRKMDKDNFGKLRPCDWVKFVVASKEDYQFALKVMEEYDDFEHCNVAFSPMIPLKRGRGGRGGPSVLANWMLRDNVFAVFNLQIHKYIWPEIYFKKKGKVEEH